jgi:hypothetical protein
MIARADIVERVFEWQLTEEVIEKDYVLGWLLWRIATDPVLSDQWVFKGGTCLKKCYIETYRFSEDLDFTVLPGGPIRPEDVTPLLQRTLARVSEASGIDFYRTYGVDKIAGLHVTTTPFTPRFPIEFSARGPLQAPLQSRSAVGWRAPRAQPRVRPYGQPEYIYACNVCGREFVHSRRSSALRQHKDPYGYACRGRSGRFIGRR